MDLSDGLAARPSRLAAASKCSFRLDPSMRCQRHAGATPGAPSPTARTMNCSSRSSPRLIESLRRRLEGNFFPSAVDSDWRTYRTGNTPVELPRGSTIF